MAAQPIDFDRAKADREEAKRQAKERDRSEKKAQKELELARARRDSKERIHARLKTYNPSEPLKLKFNAAGIPTGFDDTVMNFERILSGYPFTRTVNGEKVSTIRFNLFTNEIMVCGPLPWRTDLVGLWTDADTARVYADIEDETGLRGKDKCEDAIENVARKNAFHPIRDLLDSLPYQGPGYVEQLLTVLLKTRATPYNVAALRTMMRGAIARIYRPGCKYDYCFVLCGHGGSGKTTFLTKLTMDTGAYNGSLSVLGGKDAMMSLSGSWIIELAELVALSRSSRQDAKAFLTNQSDKFRPAYGHRDIIVQRQCVFCGTSNDHDFLCDPTGNRRFLILDVEAPENGAAEELRNDVGKELIRAAWAEVLHDMRPELNSPKEIDLRLPREFEAEAEEHRHANMADDGTAGLIASWLESDEHSQIGNVINALQIWREALNGEGQPPKWKASLINDIIRATGEFEPTNGPQYATGDAPTRRISGNDLPSRYGKQRGFKRVKPPQGDATAPEGFASCAATPF